MCLKSSFVVVVALLAAGLGIAPAFAQQLMWPVAPDPISETLQPTATVIPLQAVETVDRVQTPAIDLAAVQAEDEASTAMGEPPRFAIPNPVFITPANHGTWEYVDNETLVWRLRITCPGAESINLGFTRYYMPAGAYLFLYSVDGAERTRAFTDVDNFEYRELWTPVVLSDDIVVELTIPEAAIGDLDLELGAINHGYRFFHKAALDAGEPRSHGACEIDIICPDADGWRTEIPAIGVYTLSGSWTCSGSMINNTAQNQTPYFLTAYHCGITSSNASTVVVYWNYYSPTCGAHSGGSLSQYQSGSSLKARYSSSDFCLIQLSSAPNPSWLITFAGWDRTDTNTANPVGIHHPECEQKSISFTTTSTSITTYLSNTSPGDATHLKVTWQPVSTNRGVTEPGSSGSPIFDTNHRIRGQLHGGYSACGASDMRDWYGRVFKSWTGGGASSSRLSDWLDPGSTGATYVDTLNPYAGDTTPPTPNPMTFASAPAPVSTSSITMTATTATDATTPPVSYYFHFVSGGTGGTDSAWQSSTTYTDTGLAANTSYTYQVKARDSVSPTPNETTYSGNASTATYIETPTGVSFGTVTADSIVLNAGGSFTNLTTGTSGLYFDSTTTGGDGGINAWVTVTTDTATGLSPNTSYTFQVKARNQNSVETAYSPTAAKATLANVPTAPALSGATLTTLNLDVNANGNPAATEFAVQCTSSSPSDSAWTGKYVSAGGTPSAAAVWRTEAQWGVTTVTGLQSCTSYTFAVKARNSESVETAFGPGASLGTTGRQGDLNGDGVVDGKDIQPFVNCAISGGSGCACANVSIAAFVDCLLNPGACP